MTPTPPTDPTHAAPHVPTQPHRPAGPAAAGGPAPNETAQTAPAPAPAPAPAVLEIDGTAYSIPPLSIPMAKLADEIDKHLLDTRPDPFKSLAEALTHLQKHDLPKAIQERIQTGMIDRCLADAKDTYRHREFDPQAVSTWLQSFDGGCWLLWRQLRQKYPDIELAKVRTAIINRAATSHSPAATSA